MSNTNLIIESVNMFEIINGLNTGLYRYNDIDKVRIINDKNQEYVIIPVEADVSIDLLRYISEDKELKVISKNNVVFDSTVLDYVVLHKTVNDGKAKVDVMSLIELQVATSQLENIDDSWDFNGNHYRCVEIDYVEAVSNINTDMNIFG